MKVSAAAWNRLLRRAGRIWPVRFYHRPKVMGWPTHPWAPQPAVDEWGRFGIRLVPGLVNGRPAFINMKFRDAPPAAQKRIRARRRKAGLPQPASTENVRVDLDEGPLLAPVWRPVDPNDPTRVLPSSMRGMGGIKNIYATEIILTTNLTSSFGLATYRDTGGGAVEAEVNVAYRVVPPAGFAVQCVANFEPPKYEFSTTDVFFNRYQEPTEAQVKIATLYGAVDPGYDNVLSPRWSIAAQPDLYHNLAFHDRAIPPAAESQPLRFVTPLGIGLANGPAYLASNNEATAAALSFFAPRRTGGMYHAV